MGRGVSGLGGCRAGGGVVGGWEGECGVVTGGQVRGGR